MLRLPPARDDFWHVGDRVDAREAVGAVRLEPPPHVLAVVALLLGVVPPDLDRARAELERAERVVREAVADVDELGRRAARPAWKSNCRGAAPRLHHGLHAIDVYPFTG